MIKKLLALSIVFLCLQNAKAEENFLENLIKDYNSQYIAGYLKPLFTSIQEGNNSNLYTNTNFKKGQISIAIDLAANAMLIPESQKTFTTNTPSDFDGKNIFTKPNESVVFGKITSTEQPTIYGGKSTPVFTSDTITDPNKSHVKSYLEGFNISKMSTLPVLQSIIRLPTQTEVRLRGIGGFGSSYFGLIVNQRLDGFIDIFGSDNKHNALGVSLAYSNLGFNYSSIDNSNITQVDVSMTSLSFGVTYNYEIENNFNFYSGLSFETSSGEVKAVYTQNQTISNIEPSIETYTKFKALGGLSYKLGFLGLHTDAAYASQPIFTAGLTFWFGTWDDEELISK